MIGRPMQLGPRKLFPFSPLMGSLMGSTLWLSPHTKHLVNYLTSVSLSSSRLAFFSSITKLRREREVWKKRDILNWKSWPETAYCAVTRNSEIEKNIMKYFWTYSLCECFSQGRYALKRLINLYHNSPVKIFVKIFPWKSRLDGF